MPKLTDAEWTVWSVAYDAAWADCLRAIRDGASDYERRRMKAKARARLCFEDEVTASLIVDDEEMSRGRRR